MIAAYCRVSTVRQKADSQINEIAKWLAASDLGDELMKLAAVGEPTWDLGLARLLQKL